MATTPFDNLDSAHEYLRLLAIQVHEVSEDIQQDIAGAGAATVTREIDALHLVAFKLRQLDVHLRASRGVLNDLRMLRRVLTGERAAAPTTSECRSMSEGEVQRKSPL